MIAHLILVALLAVGNLPDPHLTPGVVNPAVTQANIHSTICVPGYSKSIRPPNSYTRQLKLKQLSGGPYRSNLGPQAFEEDHLISLELGGHPTDPRNLWPQHWSTPLGAREKDRLENYLHTQVCSGHMTLKAAQTAISSNWITTFKGVRL